MPIGTLIFLVSALFILITKELTWYEHVYRINYE